MILPPSLLEPMKDADTLRVLIVAGESCWRALVDEWAVGRRMFDAYGPTEITVCATIGECRAGRGVVNIGRPIEGTRVYVRPLYRRPRQCHRIAMLLKTCSLAASFKNINPMPAIADPKWRSGMTSTDRVVNTCPIPTPNK